MGSKPDGITHFILHPIAFIGHCRRMGPLTDEEIRRAVQAALAEDVGAGDVTTLATVPENATARAVMKARESLVPAGLAFAEAAFRELSPTVKITRLATDGQRVASGRDLLRVEGSARAILSAERVALNFAQRLSGVATLTSQFVEAIRGTSARILDTRKTTPGWRHFEKYAVVCGGGQNLRIGLFDMVLIKDNHLAALRDELPNAIAAAVQRARAKYPDLKIEVEADTLEQVRQALDAGADIVLLDNMTPDQLREAVQQARGRAQTEASGGGEYLDRPRHCGDGRGPDFRRRAHAFRARGGHRAGFRGSMTIDTQILAALRAGGNGGVAGTELSQKLGISRAAVWARIQELRTLGYEVEASPHLGYRLLSAPDLLHSDDLLAGLGKTSVIGRDIRVFEETTSTNDVIEKLARDGVKEGAVVFAESQTKGRGRMGRKWVSPSRKGLWFSVLLRPAMRPAAVTQLTIAAAVALFRAIRAQTGVAPEIKWPNDLLMRGKKIAGILTELSAELDKVKHVILGIGISVNLTATEFPPDLRKIATSLRIETGQRQNRADLAIKILQEFDRDYERICAEEFEAIADEWEEHCATLGQNVVIHTGDRTIRGAAESLDTDGALLLRTQHGRLERIIGGDVTIEK